MSMQRVQPTIPGHRYRQRFAACTLVLVFAIAGGALRAQVAETPEAQLARLIKEGLGLQAPKAASTPQSPIDAAIRSQFHGLIEANRDYANALRQIDPTLVRQLGTPQSLSDPLAATAALQQLHHGYAIEVEHEQKTERIYARLRHTLETADWDAATRQRILMAFDNAMITPSRARQQCIAAEKFWIDSMDALYTYAGENHALLRLVDGSLTISDPNVQANFNTRILNEEAQRNNLQKAKAQYAKMQSQVLKAFGVSPESVGLR